MANYNKMTKSKYNAVKLILKGGASVKEAAQYMQITDVTVYKIRNTETWEEYQNIVAEKGIKRREKVADINANGKPIVTDDKQKGGTMSANYQINRIYEALKAQCDLLTLISNKLAYIVEELTK